MAGLNYGRNYKKKKGDMSSKPVGVHFQEWSGKWVVRVLVKDRIQSIKQVDTEGEADLIFKSYKPKQTVKN